MRMNLGPFVHYVAEATSILKPAERYPSDGILEEVELQIDSTRTGTRHALLP
jgi:hypothetical protein